MWLGSLVEAPRKKEAHDTTAPGAPDPPRRSEESENTPSAIAGEDAPNDKGTQEENPTQQPAVGDHNENVKD